MRGLFIPRESRVRRGLRSGFVVIPVVIAIAAFIFAFTATELSPHFKEPVTIKTPVGPQLSIGYNRNNQLDITVSEVGYTIFDSQGSKPGFNFADGVTVTGSLTVSELISGKNGLELTGGSLNLQGLGDSIIDASGKQISISSNNLTVTNTGINNTAIGASVPSTGSFTTLSSSSNTQLSTSQGALLQLGNSGADIQVKGNLVPSGSVSIGTAGNSFQAGYFKNLNTDSIAVTNNATVGGDLTVGGTVNGLSISGGVITIGTWQGSVVSPQYGGTGLTSYTAGDLVYASATDTLSQLNVGSNGNCLIVTAGMPAWGACAGVANTLQDTYNNGNQITTTDNRNLQISLANTATDSNFVVTTSTGSTGGVAFVRADGAGTADPSQMLLIDNQDTDRVLPIGLKIQSAAGGITTAIDLTDSDIVTAISAGANNLQGTFWSIDGSNGNISTSGTITSGLINGQTISSSANFTGSLTVANGLTVTAGSVLLPAGSISNSALANSSLTVSAGDALTGGGSVALGGSITLNVSAGTNISTAGDQISVIDNPTFATSVTTPSVTSTGSLSVTSGGAGDLTLGSASGTVKLAAGSNILQRENSGTFTIDLKDVGTTILALDNTGAGAADLNIVSGGLQVAGTTVITNAKVLQNVTADASILTSGTVAVARGGTGSTSVGSAGSLAYSNGSSYAFSGVGGSGQVILSGGTGAPTFTDIASIATTAVTAGTGLSGGGTVGGLTLNLANTAVSAGTYGSSTAVGQFTVDAQGRITAASNVTISGVAPGGSAGGDLSGTYPNPTVAKINGATLGSTTATAGNILIGSGTGWETRALSGDATLSSTGVLTVANGAITNAKLANSSLTVTAGDGISGGGTVSLGGTITLNVNAGTNISTAGDLVSVVDNPTFSGKVTGSVTGGTALELSGAPAASATSSLFQLGPAIAGGSANGTYIGINPAAFSGNFVDFQVGGTSAFKVTASGDLTATGTINGATISGGTLSGGTVSGGSLSATAVNGLSVSGGTISAGTWNGTVITDSYIADTLTIDASSSVQWVALTGYPSACSAGTAVTAVGDTLTCTAFNTDTSVTLQDAYSNGNTITTLDATDIDITLANTTTDANFTIDIATGSTGKFAVQGNGTDIFRVSAAENRILSNGLIIDTGGLTVTAGTVSLPAGEIGNAELANSSLTVTAGTGLSGGGAISLGGSATINLANTAVTAGSYGTASSVASFTVDAQGRLTAASDIAIAIAASQITSGTLGVARGGTGLSSYTIGDLIYADGATSLAKLAGVATGNVLISGGVATAPSWGKVVLGTHTTGNYVSTAVGTADRITVSSATGDVTFNIAATYVGQASITTLGTIGTGTWNGTTIGATYGGTGQSTWATGDLLYASASNTLAKRTIGSSGDILTVSGGLPTWASLSSLSIPTGTGTSGYVARWTGTNTLGTGVLIDNGTNVGVGTSPLTKFHVSGVIRSSGASGENISIVGTEDGTAGVHGYLTYRDTGLTRRAWIGFGNTSGFDFSFTNEATGHVYITTNGKTMTFSNTGQIRIPETGSGAGILIGSDTQLYRSAADVLRTPDSFTIDGTLTAGTYTGQSSIVTLGTITTGTWNGTVITDSYIADTLTIDASSSVQWVALTGYPSACSAGSAITALGDSPTCTAFNTDTSISLQDAYDIGNTITTTDNRDLGFTLADTTTDSNFLVNIATGSTGKFAVQDNGSDIFRVTSSGVTIASGGIAVTGNSTIAGTLTGLTGLTVSSGTVSLPAGQIDNAELANSSLTVTAGTGLSGGGSISLGGSATINLANTAVTAGSYGTASSVASFTVDAQGRLTAASDIAIAIAASQITSGTLGVARGGTGLSSYTIGDLIYADGATSLAKLAGVATGNVLISGGVATAPSWGKVALGTHTTGNYVSTAVGTADRITVSSATGDVTFNIAATYVGQASITTLGTIGTGTWNGTAIGATYGGTGQSTWATGDLLYASASNTLAKRTIGSSGDILTVSGGLPTWASLSSLSIPSGTGTNTHVTYWTGTNTQAGNAAFTFNAGTGQLALSTTGSGAGILIGGDTQLYRSAADVLLTPDSFTISGSLLTMGTGNINLASTTMPQTSAINIDRSGGSRGLTLRTTSASANAPMIIWDDAFTPYSATFRYALRQSGNTFTLGNYPDGGSFTNFLVVTSTAQLQLPTTGSSAGILIGGDVNLYRTAANVLAIPDTIRVGSDISTSVQDAGGTYVVSQIGSLSPSGYASVTAGVVDGTNNPRAHFFVDATNSAWGFRYVYSTGANYPFVVMNAIGEGLRIDGSNNVAFGTTTTSNGKVTIRRSTTGAALTIRNTGDSGNTFVVTDAGVVSTGTWNGTAIGVAYGGTGLSSYTIGDLIYADGATSLAKLAGVATGNVLISGGVATAPSWGKVVLGTHTTGNYVSTITGTANQVTASASTGDITLSLPQNIHTAATPTFGGLTVSNLTAGRVTFAGTAGVLSDSSAFTYTTGTGQLALSTTGSGAGILIGGDTQIYRSAADVLRTPDSLTIDSNLTVTGTSAFASTMTLAMSDTVHVGPWVKFSGGSGVGENTILRFVDRGTATSNIINVEFAFTPSEIVASRIRSIINGSSAANGSNLVFETASDNASTWNSNQLYLKSDGLIGMGTASPSQKLHISGSIRVTGGYYDSSNSVGTTSQVLIGGSSATWGSVVLGTHTTGNYVSTITGTTNRLTASASTGDITLDIAATYVGQTSITTLGTIGTGTWNGTAITDTYIADTLTVDASSSVQWTALTSYPSACTAGSAVTTIGDTLTCSAFGSVSGTGVADYTARWTGTSTLGTGMLRDNGTGVSIGTSPTTGRSLIVSRSATNQDSSTQVAIQGSGTGTATNNDNTRLLIGFSGSPAAVVTTISSTFSLDGFYASLGSSYVATGLTNAGTISGVRSQAFINTASHVGTLMLNVGGSFQAGLGSTATGNGFITSVYGIVSEGMFAGTGTITNYFGLRVVQSGTTAVVTNMYGLYEDLSASGSGGTPRNYLKNFLGIGITSPGDALHIGAGSVRITDLTASRLVSTDANKSLASVSNLTSWIAGTTNRLTATDDGDGTITLDISSSYVGQASITTLGTIGTGTWNGTAIGATYGGTGQSTWTTGDLLYASATNTLSKRAIGSTGDVLTVSGGVPSWASLSSLSIPSGTGTSNYVTKWTGTNTQGNSLIRDDGTGVAIGSAPFSNALFGVSSTHTDHVSTTLYGGYINSVFAQTDTTNRSYFALSSRAEMRLTGNSSAATIAINGTTENSYVNTGITNGSSLTAIQGYGVINSASHLGIQSNLHGGLFYSGFGSLAGSGTVTNLYGVRVVLLRNSSSASVTSNYFGLHLSESGTDSNVATRYGIYETLAAGAINRFGNRITVSSAQANLGTSGYDYNGTWTATTNGAYTQIGVRVVPTPSVDSGVTNSSYWLGVYSNVRPGAAHAGTVATQYGALVDVGFSSSSGAGTISNVYGIYVNLHRSAAGTIGSSYGVRIQETVGGTPTTVTGTRYGFYEALASGAINYFANDVGIGTTSVAARLHIAGNVSRSAWGTNGIGIRVASATYTDTSSSGTVAAVYSHMIDAGVIDSSSATTYTRAYGLFVDEPTATGSAAITHGYGIYSNARNSRFDRVVIGRSGTNYGGIGENLSYVAGSTAWNYQSTDTAALLRFNSGGFQFFGAASGTVDTAITFTQLMYIDRANGGVVIGTTSSAAALLQIGGSSTRSAWGLNGVGLRFDAGTYTDGSTSASGTVTDTVIHSFARPTITGNTGVTFTNAATFYIANSPLAGGSTTITNAYALWIDDGNVRFDGNVGFGGIAPVAAVDINGALVARSSGSLVTITADNQTVTTNDRTYIRLTSDNATATNRTFKLGAGVRDGQILVLEWTYTGTPYFGELLDNAGDFILLNGDWSPTLDDSITLIYNGSYWVELSRSSN